MERSVVSEVADVIYESLGPAFTDGLDLEWQLLSFVAAQASTQEQVWSVTHDGSEPWEIVMDPDRCPDFALPWLAALSGVRTLPSWNTDQIRDAIRTAKDERRGSPGAIRRAVQLMLTGSQFVDLRERYGGNAYVLYIRVQASEVIGHPSNVLDAIRTQKPGGIVLDFDVIGGQTYADLETHAGTYAGVEPLYPTYTDVRFAPA